MFSALWIYFAVPIHEYLADQGNRAVLLWGYGHYFVFGSAAAIGAGIEVAVEEAVGEAHISTFAASAAVTIPAAMFLIFVWLMHSRHFKRDRIEQAVLPVSANPGSRLHICRTLGCPARADWWRREPSESVSA